MTGTELSDASLGHIGNRASGMIGAETVATSARSSVNFAMEDCVKGVNPPELKDETEIDVSTSNYSYSVPTTNTSGTTIRVKSMYVARLKQDDETTGRPLYVLPDSVKDSLWPIMDSSRTARPRVVGRFGDTLKLYPWPDDDYVVHLKVNTWPTRFTAATIGTDSPLNDEWDPVIIAWAVHDLFAKLQQVEDSENWLGIYTARKRSLVGELRLKPNQTLDGTLNEIPAYVSADYARDPFWNMEIY